MKKLTVLLIPIVLGSPLFAQQQEDSSIVMDEAIVKSFELNKTSRNITASIAYIVPFNNGDRNNKLSIVNGMNAVAGVRMEERSPGSYRLNIRGSSLRSPFGVRNVKVYWNNLPLTDAGGNTYFNQLAYNNFSSLEIFKGPAGSLYGAGTGGLIILNGFGPFKPGISLEYITGSFGLQNILMTTQFGKPEAKNQLTFAHNQSDGYRVQSAMRRDNLSWQTVLQTSMKNKLSASLLFTDMYYQTPGALTLAEYNKDPKAARPAGGGFPSAVNAHAAISQKNFLTGVTNELSVCTQLKNVTTVYGMFNSIRNPAIRNYERRLEPGFGGRTHFAWTNLPAGVNRDNTLQLVAGMEFNQGYFNSLVSKNKNGQPDTTLTNDDVRNTNYSLFLQADASIKQKWFLMGGLSLNKTNVIFRRLNKYPVVRQEKDFNNELAPRLSVKRNFGNGHSLSATVSRGFSPPTMAELLPSTGVISTELEAEFGWNYEAGAQFSFLHRQLTVGITGYYFRLNNALVQRRDLSGADYFVNAGDSKQKGIETTLNYQKIFHSHTIEYISIQASHTLSDYRYGSFKKGSEDFSGKRVPSVPKQSFAALADMQLKFGLYTNLTYYHASSIYLNDANSFRANAYDLLGARLGWKNMHVKSWKLSIYAGADNLFDQTYSLGNDINAAANRFFNAAPGRNYYAGIVCQWLAKKKS